MMCPMNKRSSFLTLFILFFTSYLFGQDISVPGNYLFDFDKMKDTVSMSLFPSIRGESEASFRLLQPFVKSSYNTGYVRSYDDGPIWKGRGLNMEAYLGFAGKTGGLSYAFYPVIASAQNAYAFIPDQVSNNRNTFNYRFDDRIDWVQRYGNEGFAYFHLGQSEIKYDFGKIRFGVSTQNYEAGPSNFNPIILSRNAGGFPHSRISIEPFNATIKGVNIGNFEVNMIHGLLRESDYFDLDSENDNRYFNGLFIAYQPSFLEELTLGLNRVVYKQTQYFRGQDLFAVIKILDDGSMPNGNNTANDTFDGLASFTLEWKFSEIGFRSYLEYARNDFTGTLRNTLVEPDGGQRAYLLGFEKMIQVKQDRFFYIQYEHINLSRGPVLLYRPVDSSYYTHGVNRQGYTHNGQVIGAGVGPGGTSDNLGFKLIMPEERFGLLIQRIEANRDYFNEFVQNVQDHDQEYTVQGYYAKSFEEIEIMAEAGFSYNYNRFYLSNKVNVFLSLAASIKL